jgi:hypothetical protein
MDCETFERIVLDRVYLELDELTMGAAQRHVAHCSRCRSIEVGLRATREVCRLPPAAPAEGFAEGVVAFERQIRAVLPLRQRANRAVSVLAAYAMRPQPTMAALLLLMIGASLFLVRARPTDRALVQITERGVPEMDPDQNEVRATGIANSLTNGSTDSSQTPHPLADEHSPSPSMLVSPCSPTAAAPCERNASTTPPSQAQTADAELEAARSVRKESGCAAAIGPFDAVRLRYPGLDAGLAATWDAADCYLKLRRSQEARALLQALVTSPKYAKRARAQLNALANR